MRKLLLLLLISGCTSLAIFAEGYQVNLQGHKQIGMGHTGTALLFGSSSIHFNPGALPFMKEKFSFSGGVSLINSFNTYQSKVSNVTAKTSNPMGTPFYFYGAMKITDKLVAGIGITTPFGNSVKWDDNWAGRYLIQNISLKAFFFQPTLAYKITDQLSVGAGLVYTTGKVKVSRAIPVESSTGEGNVELEGTTSTLGGNFGIMFQLNEKFGIGISYRTKMINKMKDGDATFNVPNSVRTFFPEGNKFDAELPYPSNLNIGLAYHVNEKFLLALDVNRVGWEAYDSLVFDFKVNTVKVADSHNPRKWESTFIFRLGGQYSVSETLDARAGVYYDQTPTQEDYFTPESPGANKIGMSCGLSYRPVKNLSIDCSFLYIKGMDRDANYLPTATPTNPEGFGGTYKTAARIFGLGVSYDF